MLCVYADINAYEQLLLEPENYPIWIKVLNRKTPVFLNITDDILNAKIANTENDVLGISLQQYAGITIPEAQPIYFENIKADENELLQHPRSVFILDISIEKAQELRDCYGQMILSIHDMQEDFLIQNHINEISKAEKIDGGWRSFFSPVIPISNSVVISDLYLFGNHERVRGVNVNRGIENVIYIAAQILPQTLSIDYHFTLVSHSTGASVNRWKEIHRELEERLQALRDFEIKLEIILTTKENHKRRFMTNYLYGKGEHGFDIFKCSDPEVADIDADFDCYSLFGNLESTGMLHREIHQRGIHKVVHFTTKTLNYINGALLMDHERLYVGENPEENFTLTNRLLK
jgi:hypothetical protein